MRSHRSIRLACLATVTGLGIPLAVTLTPGATIPAAGATLHPINLSHNAANIRRVMAQAEKQGYQARRAAYFDRRHVAGTRPITVRAAARLRASAATHGAQLHRSTVIATTNEPRPSVQRAAGLTWQPLPETDTLEVGRTSSNFEEVSGRVSALAVDSTGTIFAGAAQGGVWRMNPQTGAWTPLTDNLGTLAVGALAIAPSNENVIYLGSGEGDLSGDSYYGDGIYRSDDGGTTWKHVAKGAPFVGASVAKMAVDPANSKVVYAATTGGVGGDKFVRSPFQKLWGVYRSSDG